MTEQEIAGEINGYKQQLNHSYYKVMKAVERIFTASSITDLLSAISAAAKEIAEIIAQRPEWRAKINELEAVEPDQPEAPQAERAPLRGRFSFTRRHLADNRLGDSRR